MRNTKKLNTFIFIERGGITHNYKYDYSLVEYINSDTKVKIICPIHGIFEQTSKMHLNRKCGCPKCVGKYRDTEQLKIDFIDVHGYLYDYSLVNFINVKTKVKIMCKEHGVFEMTPNSHLNGNGCPKCIGKYKNTEQIIKEFVKIHCNKYDYSLVEYINSKLKVKITCPEHGVFEQTPSSHLLYGCPKCGGKNKITTEEFIKKCIEIYGVDKYDYSLVVYINTETKVKIICKKHNTIFEQTPHNHLRKHGCPICKESKGEKEIRKKLDLLKIKYITQKRFDGCKYKYKLPFDFYLQDYNCCIEFDGIQHFKPIKKWGGTESLEITKIKDEIKTTYCFNNNIKLLRIRYDEIIEQKLNEFLGEKNC